MSDDVLRTFGVSDEAIERQHRIKERLILPAEADAAAVVWAVSLDIADDRMIPTEAEQLNGVVVPRPSKRSEDGSYILLPSRIKRGTQAVILSPDDARMARARYLLFNSYYVRAYSAGRLSYIEKDAVRRLYWNGGEPPRDPEQFLVDAEIRRAIEGVIRPRKPSA